MDADAVRTLVETDDRHWWHLVRRDLMCGLVRREAPATASRLLDVGCGSGGNAAAFRDRCGFEHVAGVDVAPECVAAARSRGLDVIETSGARLPFDDGAFDVVVALDVIEHIEDDAAALAEFLRVLADDGLLLLSVPAHPWLWAPHDDRNRHVRRYTRRTLTGLLQGAPLDGVRIRWFGAMLMPAAVPARLFARLTGRHGGEDRPPPAAVNAILRALFALEGRAVLAGLSVPPGLSLVATARKRDARGAEAAA